MEVEFIHPAMQLYVGLAESLNFFSRLAIWSDSGGSSEQKEHRWDFVSIKTRDLLFLFCEIYVNKMMLN